MQTITQVVIPVTLLRVGRVLMKNIKAKKTTSYA
jgi:hypothetical protein